LFLLSPDVFTAYKILLLLSNWTFLTVRCVASSGHAASPISYLHGLSDEIAHCT
jgi:hypothetical protein